MHLMMLHICLQIKECVEAAMEVVRILQVQDGGAWPFRQGKETCQGEYCNVTI